MIETAPKMQCNDWSAPVEDIQSVSDLRKNYNASDTIGSYSNKAVSNNKNISKKYKVNDFIPRKQHSQNVYSTSETHSNNIRAFYTSCFGLDRETRKKAFNKVGWNYQRPRTSGDILVRKRDFKRNFGQLTGHIERDDGQIMMAPRLPDIAPRIKTKIATKTDMAKTSVPKRVDKQSGEKLNSGWKTNKSQASSSGSSYSANQILPSTKKMSTPTSTNSNAKIHVQRQSSQGKLSDDIIQTGIDKLGYKTLKSEKNTFSLSGASDRGSKVTHSSKQTKVINKLFPFPKSKPLHHSASESQLQTPGHDISNYNDINRPFQYFCSNNVNGNNSRNISRNSNHRFDSLLRDKTTMSGNVGGMRSYNSTFALNAGVRSTSRDTGSARTTDDMEHEAECTSTTDRIYEWLINADDAEDPPEQVIDHDDAPRQTDTAVHIIYNGD